MKARYSRGAEAYDENPIHHAAIGDFLRFAFRHLAGRGREQAILDLACGSGLAGRGLRPFARTLTGVDLSAAMAEDAKRTLLYDDVVVGDMVDTMEALGRRVDAITCSGATYYMKDVAPFLAAAAAALTPGGLLLFTEFPAPTGSGTMITTAGTKRYCRSLDHTRSCALRARLVEVECRFGLCFNLPGVYWAFAAG